MDIPKSSSLFPTYIEDLKLAFQNPLPGFEARAKMAPVHRKFIVAPENAKQSATLLLLFQKESVWYFSLIQRPGNDRDKHSGQISFPGGQVEKADANFEETAKREAFEEIGIPQADIQIIGKLTETYIDVSNFNIHPFVAYLPYAPKYIIQKTEVAQVLEFPIDLLNDPSIRKVKDMQVRNFLLKNIPYFDFQSHIIWGATAMMISEFAAMH